jgi:hypothetical protein
MQDSSLFCLENTDESSLSKKRTIKITRTREDPRDRDQNPETRGIVTTLIKEKSREAAMMIEIVTLAMAYQGAKSGSQDGPTRTFMRSRDTLLCEPNSLCCDNLPYCCRRNKMCSMSQCKCRFIEQDAEKTVRTPGSTLERRRLFQTKR